MEAEQTAETVSNLVSIYEFAFYFGTVILIVYAFQNIDDSLNSDALRNHDAMDKTPRTNRKTPSICSVASGQSSSHSAASIIAESMQSAAQSLQQSKQQSADEFDTFGKYLASELRALDNIAMARRIKLKVNRFFLDAVEEEQQQQFTLTHSQIVNVDQNEQFLNENQ